MNASEIITLQALKLKSTIDGHHPTLIDALIENPANKEELKKDFRNVCALIPSMQFERLESLCSLLDLSKREVINMALNEFFVKADAIVTEVNPFENEDAARAAMEAE
jgi:hypothetical protein